MGHNFGFNHDTGRNRPYVTEFRSRSQETRDRTPRLTKSSLYYSQEKNLNLLNPLFVFIHSFIYTIYSIFSQFYKLLVLFDL